MKIVDYRFKLVQKIRQTLFSATFTNLCRDENSSSFTRIRKLSIQDIIFLIMRLSTSIQRELNSYLKMLENDRYTLRSISSSAFTQARAKLNPEAFTYLSNQVIEEFYQANPCREWHEFRLLAVDGSTLQLPYSKSIIEEFGIMENSTWTKTKSKSMARISLVHDINSQLTIDAQISDYNTAERDLLLLSLNKLQPGKDLLLADRNYATLAIMNCLQDQGIDFCMRISKNLTVVKKFMSSNSIDKIVTIKQYRRGKESKEIWQDFNKPITIRLIKALCHGKPIILCTSLVDQKKYSVTIFNTIYELRWGVEEVYKLYKSRMEVENFSGKTARSIFQDFYAKIFIMNLTAALSYPIAEQVKVEYKASQVDNKYDQTLNKTTLISIVKDTMHSICKKTKITRLLIYFDEIFKRHRQFVKPNRHFPRNKKPSTKHPINYKRL